jgi:hypothetical protein
MKNFIVLIFLCFINSSLLAQMPFSTYVMPTAKSAELKEFKRTGKFVTAVNTLKVDSLRKINSRLSKEAFGIASTQPEEVISINAAIENNSRYIYMLEAENKELLKALVKEEFKQIGKPDFLDHLNANVVSIQNGKKMFPTINGEVINYKLSVWTTYKIDAKGDTARKPHFLPISLITKVSGNYADSAAGATDDATSFFGAPLTLRFSPSTELFKNKLNDNRLFAGIHTDMRLLTIADTIKNKLQTTWGVYGSAGLTYMGGGYAYDSEGDTDAAQRHDGIWSFSAMLYFFKSGGDYNKAIFGSYEKKTLSGLELLLRFKTSKKEDAKFNFLLGASNCFTKGAANSGGWQFRLGVGN